MASLSKEQISAWIKEAHENAIERGFYDCGKCKGRGYDPDENFRDPLGVCPTCQGTGIDPNKNIGELLMLIVSELGEALEAHRCGRFAEYNKVVSFIGKVDASVLLNGLNQKLTGAIDYFESYIKNTFEDEIADVFIRLFDLCAYLDLTINEPIIQKLILDKNIGSDLFRITYELCKWITTSKLYQGVLISDVIELLITFCYINNITIEKHITAKMAYNRTRPHKHGKRY